MYRIRGIKTSLYVCRFCVIPSDHFQLYNSTRYYEQVEICSFECLAYPFLCCVVCLLMHRDSDWSAISIWFEFYSIAIVSIPLLHFYFRFHVYFIFIDICAFRVVIIRCMKFIPQKRSHILTLDRNAQISFYSFDFKLNTHTFTLNEPFIPWRYAIKW